MRVLITGATGCVGRYIVADLLAAGGYELVLALRDPARLPPAITAHPGVRVIVGDLRDLAERQEAVAAIDAAILVATSWGPDADAVIRAANLALADRLIASGCGHVIYFSTASVLRRDGSALPESVLHGTPYIRAKAELTAGMEARVGKGARITGLFPTLVVGGGAARGEPPLSHLARLLRQVVPYIGLLRLLSAKAWFHMIHAADIATVCRHLLERPETGGLRVVLGNPVQSLDQTVAAAARHLGRRHWPVLALRPWLAEALIFVLRIRLSPWDRWCMDHPDQSYADPVNPARYGLPVVMPDTGAALALVGVAGVRRRRTRLRR